MTRKEYQRIWRSRNPGYYKRWRKNHREFLRQWRIDNRGLIKERRKNTKATERFGSLERYEEAMLKYDGWCAFACDKEAEMVHHLDGKRVHNSSGEDIDNTLENLLPLCISCHSKLHLRKDFTRR